MKALVTGAGQRLGRHIAETLGERGADVFLHYHQSEQGVREAQQVVERNGGRAFVGQADLSTPSGARTLVQMAHAAMGGLDLVVASAASFERLPFSETDDEAFARSLDLNLRSPYALVHEAAPWLKQSRGSAIFITCTSSLRPFKGYLAYSVSKGALRQLMLALSQELAPEVRVNAIAPGTVLPPLDTSDEQRARYARAALLDRIGTPEDITRAVLYLVDSPFVTGQELRVDGGRL